METDMFSLDYTELNKTVEELFPQGKVPGFSEIVCGLMDGEIPFRDLFSLIKESGYHGLFYGIVGVKELVFIAIVAAVFYILSKTGRLGQAAQTGFFVAYLLIVAGAFRIFDTSREIVGEALDALLDFMKALLPAYCAGISVASGSLSASVFYSVAMLGIAVVGTVLLNVVLPVIGLYFMLSVLNRILEEDFLSKLAGLFYSIADSVMKVSVAAVLGIGTIQGMIAPAADAVKRSALIKTAGALPVVGDLLDGTSQTVLAAGVLLKNSIGAAGAVTVFLLCLIPLLRVGIANVALRFGSAVLQPVSDKRITDCLGYAAKTHKLLVRLILYTMLLFLLTIVFILILTGGKGGSV
ncbi:MAG: stage III sporulation protein AE [Lachnospiraceae bacterium]|nr:stage III sporulation protein AE [Lachnospiraceae bacterium]